MTHVAKVSGAVVLNQMAAARTLASEATVAEALATLPDDVKATFDAVLPVSWCPLMHVRAFHEAVAAAKGEDANVWHKRVVEKSMEQTFSTIWRFFLKLTTPEAMVKRAALVYAKTFDTGTMEARLVEKGHSEAILSRWPDVPTFHLEALATGIATMLRVAGRKTTIVRYERTRDGARFIIRTEPQ